MEVKEEIDKSIIIVEDKIDNCIEELNNQLNLIYIYRIVYPTTAEYIFLANLHYRKCSRKIFKQKKIYYRIGN